MDMQRPITSGSRQAPDPYDQYLESRGLYRKHTARDASSLFRVIAEQMYDTQMLHYEIRLECVRFMTLKRRIFEKVWISPSLLFLGCQKFQCEIFPDPGTKNFSVSQFKKKIFH